MGGKRGFSKRKALQFKWATELIILLLAFFNIKAGFVADGLWLLSLGSVWPIGWLFFNTPRAECGGIKRDGKSTCTRDAYGLLLGCHQHLGMRFWGRGSKRASKRQNGTVSMAAAAPPPTVERKVKTTESKSQVYRKAAVDMSTIGAFVIAVPGLIVTLKQLF